MNPICFYHKADLDGVCSGAIVKHFIPKCEMHGIDYGDAFPWAKVECPSCRGTKIKYDSGVGVTCDCSKRTIYMVDFSLPVDDMKRLAQTSNLIWIDHHKTAIDSLEALDLRGYYCEGFGACELAYAFFMAQDETGKFDDSSRVPEVVRLLGRYDVWDKDDPEWESKILPFQYGMRSWPDIYDPADSRWSQIDWGPTSIVATIQRGDAILCYQAEANRKACEAGVHEVVLTLPDPDKQPVVEKDCIWYPGPRFKLVDGKCEPVPDNVMPSYRVLACNTIVFNSQFFDGFFDPEKHDLMCAYAQLKDGRWKVSLYSTKPEVDCGVICKSCGGGGHKGAAGFICSHLPWMKGGVW